MNFSRSCVMGTLLGVGSLGGCGEPHGDSLTFSEGNRGNTPGASGASTGGLASTGSGGARASGGAPGSLAAGGSIAAASAGRTASGGSKAAGGMGGGGFAAGSPAVAGTVSSGSAGTAGSGSAGMPATASGTCPGLPAVTDYAAKGPFDVKVLPDAGPDGTYYLFRPDTTLGKGGLKHPVAVWGNGISTTPDQYQTLLGHIASHGIVVIACPSTNAERPCLDAGMEWLVQQNTAEGPMKGKLDTSKEITIGYSWGGGAAIDTANRPNVKATISIHGMPPREADAWTAMKSPLLLFTSTGDTFVNAEEYVTPNYESSTVQTFYATLGEPVGHLYPIDTTALSCVASILLGGPCSGAEKEQAPIVAWMRLWACDDSNAKKYFYGADCILCKSPWIAQSKPVGAFK